MIRPSQKIDHANSVIAMAKEEFVAIENGEQHYNGTTMIAFAIREDYIDMTWEEYEELFKLYEACTPYRPKIHPSAALENNLVMPSNAQFY